MRRSILLVLFVIGFYQILFGQNVELVTPKGHGVTVLDVVFSPDGKILASASQDKSVNLWDVEKGIMIRSFFYSQGFWSLTFNSNGKLLAAGGSEKSNVWADVIIWDVENGKEIFKIKTKGLIVSAIAFSPNDEIIAIAVGNEVNKHSIELWNISTNKKLEFIEGHSQVIKKLSFSSDGRYLFSGSSDKTLKAWDVSTGNVVETYNNFSANVTSSNDAKLAAVANEDKIKILDVATNKEKVIITVKRNSIYSLNFSPDNKFLVGSGFHGVIHLWETKTGKELKKFTGNSFFFNSVSVNSVRGLIALGDTEGTVKLWDIGQSQLLKPKQETSTLMSMGFSYSGSILATASMGNTLKLWETQTKKVTIIPAISDQSLGKEILDPIGNLLALQQKNFFGARSFAFSLDGKFILVGGVDKVLRLWNLTIKNFSKSFILGEIPTSVSLSPDGKTVVGAGENSIKVWRVFDGKLLSSLQRNCPSNTDYSLNSECVPQMAFSTDGKTIAGCSNKNIIQIWNSQTGKLIKSLNRSDESARSEIYNNFPILFEKLYKLLIGNGFMIADFNVGYSDNVISDGVLFLEKETGKELARLIIYGENDWLITTPEGFFDGTPNAWKQLLWRFNNNTFDYAPVETYFNDFFYPNLLQDVLNGKSPKAPAGSELEKKDRRQPKVEIASVGGQTKEQINTLNQAATDKRTISVTVVVTDNTDKPKQLNHKLTSEVQDLRLFRNGSLVKIWHGETIDDIFKQNKSDCQVKAAINNSGRKLVCQTNVPIVAGDNNFTAYAFNGENVKSNDDAVLIKGADVLKRDGTLYVLAVGVNKYANEGYNLRFAVPDVEDIAKTITAEQGKLAQDKQLKQYAKTEIITLTDETATKDNILSALNRFSKSGVATTLPKNLCAKLAENRCAELKSELSKIKPVQPEDALLIYYAGHGTSNGQRFYLLPHNFTGKGGDNLLIEQGVSDIELNDYLERVDAGKLLMVIDACQSGQALGTKSEGRGPMNSKGLAQLAYDKGMLILTATQSQQSALEAVRIGDKEIKHGLLTYALLAAFTNKEADKDSNRQLWEREWFDYTVGQVPLLQREAMKTRNIQIGKTGRGTEIYYLDGDDKTNPEDRSVQTPRVFYRREPEISPMILAKP